MPCNRAGITRELLSTSTSPAPQKIRKILKLPVFDALPVAMQDQQPGLIAARGRLLGDQFGRQIKMKIGGSHGGKIAVWAEKGQFTMAEGWGGQIVNNF